MTQGKQCVDCKRAGKESLLFGGRRCMECCEAWLSRHDLTGEELADALKLELGILFVNERLQRVERV